MIKRIFWKTKEKKHDKFVEEFGTSVMDEHGLEHPDPTPVALALKVKRPPTIQELIQTMCRNEMFQQGLAQQGEETFEESDDFDVVDEDGDDFNSPYEENFDHAQNIDNLKKTVADNIARKRGLFERKKRADDDDDLLEEERPRERSVDKTRPKPKAKKIIEPETEDED